MLNAITVWGGISKHALYGYSYPEKKRQTGYRTSEYTYLKIITKEKLESLISKLNHAAYISPQLGTP